MNDPLVFAAHNTVVALVLALLVYSLTRAWRNPPLAHVLWLLVLVKRVAPPVLGVDWSAVRLPVSTPAGSKIIADAVSIAGPKAASLRNFVDAQITPAAGEGSATRDAEHEQATRSGPLGALVRRILLWCWLGGAVLCTIVSATRIVRFERLLPETLPASERIAGVARQIAARLGIRRAPAVRYVVGVPVPFLWCAGQRPTIVLPIRLLGDLDETSAALILAHELAHLRRRDHWIRAVELIVATVYWWNPLVWLIRRQIHACEDLCCDAWVRWAFPDCTKRYAEVLLTAAESAEGSPLGARLLPASPFLHSLTLKARIEMILQGRFAPRVSRRSMFVIALFGFLVLPSFVGSTKSDEAQVVSNDEAPAAPADKSDARATSEFPHAVRFEQGATRFAEGDTITISEIRGTSDTFTPGNIYWIRGTYTLASRDSAILLASVTFTNSDVMMHAMPHFGWGPRSDHLSRAESRIVSYASGVELAVQRTVVPRGTGTFALFLPMSYQGAPHVSFYSTEKGGESFGGNYFGTGDSVLKKWWGTQDTDQKTTGAPAETANPENADAAPANPLLPELRRLIRFADPENANLPHVVRFEQGTTRFLDGDQITISEVHGTAETFSPGNVYRIRGTYTLASHDSAMLAAYTTARHAKDGRSSSHKSQSTVVKKGDGTFTLYLPMTYEGWPHVSFYPAGGGNGFGGNYFGTGETVLKR
jgi:beta-lactamase regulating signal transducer with metallopeptidase domain